MAKKEKHWEDDDGRTVADMSQVSRPSLFGHLPGSAYERQEHPQKPPKEKRPWEDDSLSKADRRMYIWGVLKASLLIGSVYILAFGLLILAIVLLGR